ncbi:hypothetical protein SNE40_001774 [Patella caerulea]|uniref:Peptidase A2 domain-containing protein n=1 Tax=Patella caerulea TaxID=87958 RepID=A0AAN8KAM6_PATCE
MGHSQSKELDCNTKSSTTDRNVIASLNKNFVNVTLGNTVIKSLIDTGASISCISKSLLDKVLPDAEISSSDITYISGVGGQTVEVVGNTLLEFQISNTSIIHKFYIFNYIQHDFIIGNDLLIDTNAEISHKNKTLTLNEGLIHVAYALPDSTIENKGTKVKVQPSANKEASDKILCPGYRKHQVGFVRTIKDISIDPYSEILIPAKISKIPLNEIVYIEPTSRIQKKKNLLGGKSIIKTDVNRGYVRFLNSSEEQIKIKANTIIAKAHIINKDHILDIEQDRQNHDNFTVSSIQCPEHESVEVAKSLGFNLENSDLSQKQKTKLLGFLGQYRDIFATNLTELGKAKGYMHKINTNNAPPIRSRPYRQSTEAKGITEKLTKEMLDNGVIEPSSSSWASPIVLVKKPDGSHRFAVDYRKLNQVTVPMTHPLPLLSDTIDLIAAANATIFSVIDLQSGFWQQELDPETKHKTAFVTHQGSFEFNRLPFGLRNSPAAFQMMMNSVLRGLN